VFFFPVYDIIYLPFPYGSYGVALFSIVTVYTIIMYKFMDIEVIIKKTLVFAGLFSMVMAVVVGVTTLTQDYISRFLVVSPIVSGMLSVAVAIFLYDPTRKFMVFATDKFLFQKRHDIKVILNRLSERIITILDIENLGQTILSTLRETLRLESGALLVKDENEAQYRVLDSFGIESKKENLFQRGCFNSILIETKGDDQSRGREYGKNAPARGEI